MFLISQFPQIHTKVNECDFSQQFFLFEHNVWDMKIVVLSMGSGISYYDTILSQPHSTYEVWATILLVGKIGCNILRCLIPPQKHLAGFFNI